MELSFLSLGNELLVARFGAQFIKGMILSKARHAPVYLRVAIRLECPCSTEFSTREAKPGWLLPSNDHRAT